jgi:hypothetical protein
VVNVLGCYAEDPGSSPRLFFFFNHVYDGYWDRNISLTFKFFYFFIIFFLLLTFQKGSMAVAIAIINMI